MKIVKNSKFPLDFERIDITSDLALAENLLKESENDADMGNVAKANRFTYAILGKPKNCLKKH